MKLKCQPEDFRVEELPLVSPAGFGMYTFYRLTKRNIGTIEAVQGICRSWNLAGHQVSYAGLKDRHAVTIQYLTIVGGPRKTLSRPTFELRADWAADSSLRTESFSRESVPSRRSRPGR